MFGFPGLKFEAESQGVEPKRPRLYTGVSQNRGYLILGSFIIRILLFRVLLLLAHERKGGKGKKGDAANAQKEPGARTCPFLKSHNLTICHRYDGKKDTSRRYHPSPIIPHMLFLPRSIGHRAFERALNLENTPKSQGCRISVAPYMYRFVCCRRALLRSHLLGT